MQPAVPLSAVGCANTAVRHCYAVCHQHAQPKARIILTDEDKEYMKTLSADYKKDVAEQK